ncbi:MAG TPA: hypothetical protein VGC28_01520 [Sphingomonas sp.]
MPDPIIDSPAAFVPLHALSFGTKGDPAVPVDHANPLPITGLTLAASSTPLAGGTAAAATVGPFAPQLGRAIWLTLSGSWSGSAQLLRSTDGGATRLPLTYGDGTAKPAWTGNLNAAVAEESVVTATYWLALAPTAGTVSYRLEQ